jgi:hypothetical protein
VLNPVLARSGLLIDLADPQPASIRLTDIALALSRIPRFNGHTARPWSIADHSLLVLDLVRQELGADATPDLQLAAILHDGREAYSGDIVSPVQWEIRRRSTTLPSEAAVLQELQADLDRAIARAFTIHPALFLHEAIQRADRLALAIEAHQLMPQQSRAWPNLPALPGVTPILPQRDALKAQNDFLSAVFGLLGSHRAARAPATAEDTV